MNSSRKKAVDVETGLNPKVNSFEIFYYQKNNIKIIYIFYNNYSLIVILNNYLSPIFSYIKI